MEFKQYEKPYVQTYTIVAGSEACDAKCPYCVSKMTPTHDLGLKEPEVNWRNFHIGAELANQWGASTALITGKGESTLFPEQITKFLYNLKDHNYPIIELQTNGMKLAEEPKYEKYLKEWYDLGLTTIAISIADYKTEKNKEIFQPDREGDYYEMSGLIDKLHSNGYSVRLSCIMCEGYVDSVDRVEELLEFSKENKVEQLKVTPVEKPNKSRNCEVSEWVEKHYIPRDSEEKFSVTELREHLDSGGKRLRKLVHGAIVYDYKDQNICLSNCLTINPDDTSIRQIIFFPDGHVRYDWQYPGALLF